jgi:hypothetical protein
MPEPFVAVRISPGGGRFKPPTAPISAPAPGNRSCPSLSHVDLGISPPAIATQLPTPVFRGCSISSLFPDSYHRRSSAKPPLLLDVTYCPGSHPCFSSAGCPPLPVCPSVQVARISSRGVRSCFRSLAPNRPHHDLDSLSPSFDLQSGYSFPGNFSLPPP